MGVCYSYQGRFAEGEREFERALELNPGNFHTHNNLGFCLAQQEKYEQAIPYFESCLAINSKFEEARFNLAFSLKNPIDYRSISRTRNLWYCKAVQREF